MLRVLSWKLAANVTMLEINVRASNPKTFAVLWRCLHPQKNLILKIKLHICIFRADS